MDGNTNIVEKHWWKIAKSLLDKMDRFFPDARSNDIEDECKNIVFLRLGFRVWGWVLGSCGVKVLGARRFLAWRSRSGAAVL